MHTRSRNSVPDIAIGLDTRYRFVLRSQLIIEMLATLFRVELEAGVSCGLVHHRPQYRYAQLRDSDDSEAVKIDRQSVAKRCYVPDQHPKARKRGAGRVRFSAIPEVVAFRSDAGPFRHRGSLTFSPSLSRPRVSSPSFLVPRGFALLHLESRLAVFSLCSSCHPASLSSASSS